MSAGLVIAAAAALGLERATYVWITQAPVPFRRWCAHPALARLGEPVTIVEMLFWGFKTVQASVFLICWAALSDGCLAPTSDLWALAAGVTTIVVGQVLNGSVFYRLGRAGVFFGDRLGRPVPWCRGFPFSVVAHPQYVGTVLTIWGLFLATCFPHGGWYLLPALETAYYALGAHLEERTIDRRGWASVPPGCQDSAL